MPSNYYDTTNTGAGVSNREDLIAKVTNVDPANTPLYSLASKGNASQVFHEWTLDKLDTPTTDGTTPGSDADNFEDAFKDRARIGNYCQRFFRTYGVDDFQEATESVGPADIARAEIKKMKEIARDMEATFLSDNTRQAGGSGTNPKSAGLGAIIDSSGPSWVPEDYRTPADSIKSDSSALTETDFNDIIASVFGETGTTTGFTCIAGTQARRSITSFTRADTTSNDSTYQVMQYATDKKVTFSVQQYDSDFGLVNIVNGNPKCMPDNERAYLIDPSLISVASLYGTESKRLEDQGGGPRGWIRAAATLQVDSPLGLGKITDVTA